MEVLYELGVVLALTVANGIFAMSEMAVVSARRARLQKMVDEGSLGAQAALKLSLSPGTFLSTVQIGITLIGIVAGAFGGVRMSALLSVWLATFPTLAPYAENMAFALVIALITYLSLVIGELVPKRLSLMGAERIASWVAKPMGWVTMLAYPVVKLLDYSTDAIFWALRIRSSAESPVSEDEIKIIVSQATEDGVLEKGEHDIVHNVLNFTDQTANNLMTHRSNMAWLDVQDSFDAMIDKVVAKGHSFYPVCRGSMDDVVGLVSVKLLMSMRHDAEKADVMSKLIEPLYVPGAMRALKLLECFKQSRKHVALVVDEFGIVKGIVTLIDLMESLVGELPDSPMIEDLPMVKRSDGSWLIDGLVMLDRVKAKFQIKDLPGEGTGQFETLGGFVMMNVGRIPVAGDIVKVKGLKFEVVDMDGNRVDKVLLALD